MLVEGSGVEWWSMDGARGWAGGVGCIGGVECTLCQRRNGMYVVANGLVWPDSAESWHLNGGRLRKRRMLQPREATYLYVGHLFALGRKRGDQAA